MNIDKVLKQFKKKNILITGGTGMIGRQVVYLLSDVSKNIQTVSLDDIYIGASVKTIKADLTEFSTCKELTKDMDFVFHIAGVGGSVKNATEKPATHIVPMLQMNTNVLEACKINKVPNVLFTSTIGAYAHADILKESDYSMASHTMDYASWSKRIAEFQLLMYRLEHDLHYVTTRISNCFGPGDRFALDGLVIPALMYKIYTKTEDPIVVWGDGSAVRDFTYSKDIAEGILLAMTTPTLHPFINLGSGAGHSIKELVETLHSFLDFDYEFDKTKPSGDPRRVMDITLARKELGYEPAISFKDGLKETYEWFINNLDALGKKKNYFKED